MTPTAELLNVLARHQGRENGINAADLASVMNVPVRGLRLLITALREQGHAVCGTPRTGYFVPTTPEELAQSCEFLRRRAMRSLLLLSRMSNVSLPDLLGQLRLTETEAQ